ncbi:MAG: hypothetical protein HZA12_01795 [Nitrospirae bacterium]|nr:hypothetical protein [Nitrospirota bacterium]
MKRLITTLCILLIIPTAVYADDTEIYSASTASVKPNVLLILDNSTSMRGLANTGDPYERDEDDPYTVTNSCEGDNKPCNTNTVYRFVAMGIEGRWVNHISLSSVQETCKTTLSTLGQYQGRLSGTNGSCTSGLNRTYATGDWINWLNSPGVESYPKIQIAKKVLRELINSTTDVRFGLMIFNNNDGGYLAYPISDMETGSNKADLLNTIGNPLDLNDLCDDTGSNNDLKLCSEGSGTWTPLGETLYEAMRYYSGGGKYFGGNGVYTTPIEYACQKNFVVLITDGMSTKDRHSILATLCTNGDCDGDGFEPANDPAKNYTFCGVSCDGSDYLDDVAKYLSTTDLLQDNVSDDKTIGTQNVITYTIGFGLDGADASAEKLLNETMTNGGSGQTTSYFAGDIQELSDVLAEITGEILADNTSFVAPVVPVSPENKTYSGDYVYIGFFKPSVAPFWSGNLKKYGLNLSNGVVVDKNGSTALDSEGNFLETSISYWSTTADGGIVEAGGVGKALYDRTTARNIYTYLGTNTNLTYTSNAFTTGNSALTYSMLNTANDTEKGKVINFIHGYDSFSGTPDAKREWILGDILHSRPVVIHYTSGSVIYLGANDGMLHAFEDSNGDELWGFIPPDLLGTLKNLTTGSAHPYYVDSSPKTYIYDADGNGTISAGEGDKAILIFGERRGGSSYYALDVTNPDNPLYLWRIGPAISTPAIGSVWNSSDLGQSWSEPEIMRIIIGSEVKYVFFMGGGYDSASEDVLPTPLSDTVGRAVYAVDVLTGNKLWEYSYTTSVTNDSTSSLDDMTYAIQSSVTVIDSDGNSYADRVYVGDAGGRIWRFDIGDNNTANWRVKIIFRSNPGADSSTGRKIFYSPDYIQEIGYDILYFGTGDREHPRNTDVVDRLYAVKDNGNITTPLTESNLVDVTENLLQLSSTTQGEINTILTNLATGSGWYIKLNQNSGEKVLSPASVFAKVAYFTTYSPAGEEEGEEEEEESSNACQANRGTARVYAVNYLTGEAVFNFDPTNDTGYSTETNVRALGSEGEVLKRSDRFKSIGSGIPSGVVIIIDEAGESALIGVGGGLEIPEVKSGYTTIRLYWREK